MVSVSGEKRPLIMRTGRLAAYHFFKVKPKGKTGREIVYRGQNSAKALKLSVRYLVNDVVRAELRIRGLVSQGSASRISRLSHNRGKARNKWTDKDGAKWRGATLQPVKISRVQFRLFRIS